jgi:hypothetical protein
MALHVVYGESRNRPAAEALADQLRTVVTAQDSRSPGQMPGGALQLVTGLQFQAHGV